MEPKDFIPFVILFGIIVNIFISYRSLKASRNLESVKSALSFREKAIALLHEAQSELMEPFDLSSINKLIMTGDDKAFYDALKQIRDEYIMVNISHSKIEYLFNLIVRQELNNYKKEADRADSEVYKLLNKSRTDMKAYEEGIGELNAKFIESASKYKAAYRKAISSTLIENSDEIRKYLNA